ncbi:MAG: ATP-binding protein, partial [Akkermansia sp.]|nr:ATP-binding protein [Akkermansia sp.]
ERNVLDVLKHWKQSEWRKPLVIQGARQVGKTWIMREFGRREYQHTAYLSFVDTPHAASIFEGGYDVEGVMQAISLMTGVPVEPGNTLVVLDEIQECERALNALKFLRENAPQYHIMAAGSLLGVAVRQRQMSFPVGQVDFLHLHPLNFREFLAALGEGNLVEILESANEKLLRVIHGKLVNRLKEYLYVGGMPEVVSIYARSRDFSEVRRVQLQIIQGYENDFSKYTAPRDVPRIHAVWNSVPIQLARENRKFVYKYLGEGARAREYEMAVEWLILCGLLHRVRRISKPGVPLAAYESPNAFKLYGIDCGLLGAMARLDSRSMVENNAIFEEFKGALTEQFVLQELLSSTDWKLAYWEPENGMAEVDFVAQAGNEVIPIEVKAGVNLRARSLASYRARYEPTVSLRSSLAPLEYNSGLWNIPLYLVSGAEKMLRDC